MPKILLLCDDERSSRFDRQALRECGFPGSKYLTSGIEAAKLLASETSEEEKFDLVICHERLEDMASDQFCAIIRSHPLLKRLPVLLISSNSNDAGLEFLNKYPNDILSRPYSIADLKNKISSLLKKSKGANEEKPLSGAHEDYKAFQRAIDTYGLLLKPEHSTDDYFHMGMGFLKEQNWSLAISAFRKSVHDHRLKAEAELGMAAAYKGNNDLINFRIALANAAESFVRNGRWNRGRSTFARLLQHDNRAKNPFLTEAHKYIKKREYKKAAEILQESLPLIPKALAGVKMAQLCLLAEEPQEMLNALKNTFNGNNTDILKKEIAQNLNLLLREKEERERQKAAERKWELNRRQSLKKAEANPASTTVLSRYPELKSENVIPLLDADASDTLSPSPLWQDEENELVEDFAEGKKDIPPLLAPLTRPQATSDLFAEKPKFNEFLSVVKLTWQLAKRSGKKG